MKIFHTADWHLGKIVQGVYMTEDQEYILDQFVRDVAEDRPDVVVIAGDLYDRGVPPTEAVHALDQCLAHIVLELNIPVVAISGNHDSPGRLRFGSQMMKDQGLHIVSEPSKQPDPVVLHDDAGAVHFHLIPYTEPGTVRHLFNNDTIKSHHDATEALVNSLKETMDESARHVMVGHLFATPKGQEQDNTSDSERPLAIGGAEHVDASLFEMFDYTALGHLHQAHFVGQESIRYSGSPLKYSISEENHQKGYLVVDLDQDGTVSIEKRSLQPKHDMRTVEGYIDDLLKGEVNEDYVFVRLLDEEAIQFPMERIRSVFPNALHVERRLPQSSHHAEQEERVARHRMSDMELFQAFYQDVRGENPSEEEEAIMAEVFHDVLNQD
ncbi:exonuclease SbcCD subunit D [Alkalibacillus sp. S2W]|uniref:exonuclease SbcCD subunit D n=1 Tax=Alkalibacillus sp. S2W TaxID=3386553 RepID=UPI00398C96B1